MIRLTPALLATRMTLTQTKTLEEMLAAFENK